MSLRILFCIFFTISTGTLCFGLYSVEWHKATISGSNSIIGADTTITVTLSPPIDIPPGTLFTFIGLKNSQTKDSSALPIYGPSNLKWASKSGTWSQTNGRLILASAVEFSAFCEFSFSFVISNPNESNSGSSVQVVVEQPSIAGNMSGAVLSALWYPGWILPPQVSESFNVRNSPNVLTFTQAFNVTILGGSTMTISGLFGAHSPRLCNGSSICILGESATYFNGLGSWDSDGILKITVANAVMIPAGSLIQFQIHIINPDIRPFQTCDLIDGACTEPRIKVGSNDSISIFSSIFMTAGMVAINLVSRINGNVLNCSTDFEFTTRRITENHTFTGGLNVLYFVLVPNFRVSANSSILVEGLINSGNNCTFCSISLQGISAQKFYSDLVAFDAHLGILKLRLRSTIDAGEQVSFEIPVLNGEKQDPITPWLSASGSENAYHSLRMSMQGSVLGAGTVPKFETASMRETSEVQGAKNSLSIFFNADFDLYAGSKIFISGLKGSLTSTSELFIGGSVQYLNANTSTVNSQIAWPAGDWDQTRGVLAITLHSWLPSILPSSWRRCPENCIYHFTFELINSAKYQDLDGIYLTAELGWQRVLSLPFRLDEYSPVFRAPIPAEFASASVKESNNVLRALNFICLNFSTTATIFEDSIIRISGFQESSTTSTDHFRIIGPDNIVFRSPADSNPCSYQNISTHPLSNSAHFNASSGEITTISCQRLPQHLAVSFCFEMNNSFHIANPSTPTISCRGTVNYPESRMLISIGSPNPAGILSANFVPQFIIRNVYERCKFNGSQNMIQFEIQSNFDLETGQIILIEGLLGSQTMSTSNLPVYGPASLYFDSFGLWDQIEGTLTLRLRASAFQSRLNFSIPLINPSRPVTPRSLNISAFNLVSVATQHMVGTVLGAEILVYFVKAAASESSNIPGNSNLISISIEFSLVLEPGNLLCFSGFTDAAGTPYKPLARNVTLSIPIAAFWHGLFTKQLAYWDGNSTLCSAINYSVSPFCEITFSFNITNPLVKSKPPNLTVSYFGESTIGPFTISSGILSSIGEVLISFIAQESNNIRAENNDLGFLITSNIPFAKNQIFVIYTLFGVEFYTDTIPLLGPAASDFIPCSSPSKNGFASWNTTLMQLCISINRESFPWEAFSLTIKVRNPKQRQSPLILSIKAIEPLSTKAFLSQGGGVLSGSDICRLERASVSAHFSPLVSYFVLSLSPACLITTPMVFDIEGLNQYCPSHWYFSANLSQFRVDWNETMFGTIAIQILETWEPYQEEEISIWCTSLTSLDSSLKTLNISVKMHSEKNPRTDVGFCSTTSNCIPKTILKSNISIFPALWLNASVTLTGFPSIEGRLPLIIHLRPAFPIPADTIFNISVVTRQKLSSVSNFSVLETKIIKLVRKLNLFDLSGPNSCLTPYVLVTNGSGLVSFQLSYEFQDVSQWRASSLSQISFKQEMTCSSPLQTVPRNSCVLAEIGDLIPFAQSTLFTTTSKDAMYVIVISLAASMTISPGTSLIFYGFEGVFNREENISVETLGTKHRAYVSSNNHSTISIVLENGLILNEEIKLKIALYPPRYCKQVDDPSMIRMVAVYNGLKSKATNVSGEFRKCSLPPKFVRVTGRQDTSIDPVTNVANFLALDMSIETPLALGEKIYVHGIFGPKDGVWIIRIFGPDNEYFLGAGQWSATNGTIEFETRRILQKDLTYSLNFEILCPLNQKTLQIYMSSNLDPYTVNISPLSNQAEVLLVTSSLCFENNIVQGALNNITCTFKPSFSLIGKTGLTFSGLSPTSYSGTVGVSVVFDFGQGTQYGTGLFTEGEGLVFETCNTCIISSEIGALIIFELKNSYSANDGSNQIYLSIKNTWIRSDPVRLVLRGNNAILTAGLPVQFTIGEIYESNSVKSSLNLITVAFQANAFLDAGTFITVAGLTGSQTESTSRLTVTGAQSNIFAGFGRWDVCAGAIVLMIHENFTIPAMFESAISFWIENNANSQIPPSISISASGPDPNRHVLIAPWILDGIVLGSSIEPAFTALITLEDNTVQDEMNNLTFFLRTNFVLLENTVVTISGLTGSSTSTSRLLMSGPGSDLFRNLSGSSFAEWNRDMGTIMITVANGVLIGEGCATTISIQIRNPKRCQDAVALMFSTTQSYVQIGPIKGTGLVFSGCTLRGFQDLYISESNFIQGAMNIITVSFRPNFRIAANSNITLSGIVGSATLSTDLSYLTDCEVAWQLESCTVTEDHSQAQWGRIITRNAMKILGPDSSKFSIECIYNAFEFTRPNPTCVWNSTGYGIFRACGGVLLLRTNSDIESSERTSFSFTIVNPDSALDSVIVSIATDQQVKTSFRSSILSILEPPVWIKAVINGSSRFLGDTNRITVHLVCNSFLPQNQKIYVGGLFGSITESGQITVGSAFGVFSRKGDWDQEQGIITISLLHDVNAYEDMFFEFTLRNPVEIRYNNSVYAGTFPTPVIIKQEFTDSKNVFDSVDVFYWKKCWVQSTSFVSGAQNIISVRFTPSTVLMVGSLIWLDGFKMILQKTHEVTLLQDGNVILSNIRVDRCLGTILISSSEDIFPNQSYEFNLVTENPTGMLGDFAISIRVEDFFFRTSPSVCEGNISLSQLTAKFLVSQGEQASSVIGSVNRIQLVLRPSEKLAARSTVIITGLNSSQLFGNNPLIVEGPDSDIFGYVALWNHTDQTLLLIVQERKEVSNHRNTSVVLVLRNPSSAQQGVRASVRAIGVYGVIISECQIDGPLLLHSDLMPTWEELVIFEETRVQLAPNIVTVNVRTNCILDPGLFVTLSGLDGINVMDISGVVSIFGNDASCWSGETAFWNECGGLLILQVNGSCSSHLRNVEFKFLVKNGPVAVPEKHVYIRESSDMFGASMLNSTNLFVSDSYPTWVTKEVHFSNSIPGALNTITITLLANFRLMKGSLLVLNGIYGAAVTSDLDFNNSGIESFLEYDAWDPEQNAFAISTISSQKNLFPFTFSFSLVNDVFQEHKNCFGDRCNNSNIILAFTCTEGIAFSEIVDISEHNDLNDGTNTAYLSGQIQDSDAVLGEMNRIFISLICSIDLLIGTRITIEGFSNFFLNATRLSVSGSTTSYILGSSAEWNQGKGSISLIIGTVIHRKSYLTFEFSLRNKYDTDASVPLIPITVSIYGRTIFILPTPIQGFIGITNKSVIPTFIIHILSEENKVPCSLNQLSLKLLANFPLKVGRKIWIEGLTGSITDDSFLSLGGEGAKFFNFTALWIRQDGTLIFTISNQIDPFIDIDVSFIVRNPKYVQPARAPTVSTTLVERMHLLDKSGSSCAVFSASEGPYVSFQIIVVGQSVDSLDIFKKRMYIHAISVRLSMSLAHIFIDSVQAHSPSSRRTESQEAVEISFRILSEPDQFSSLLDKITKNVPTEATKIILESRGIYPVFNILLSPPKPHFDSAFWVQAFESTTIQGSLNSISLHVRVASPISVGGFMYIGSVPPNQSPSSDLLLAGNGSDFFSATGKLAGDRSARWYSNDRTLMLHVVNDIPTSQFEIFFVLRNSASKQNYPSFQIFIIDGPVVFGPASPENLILNSETSTRFLECKINEGSRSAGQQNPLSVQLRASGPLQLGTQITIFGLNGAESPSNPSLPVFGPDSHLFGNRSTWIQETGTLILTVISGKQIDCGKGTCRNDFGIIADQNILLDFVLQNPFQLQLPQVISIQAKSAFFTVQAQVMDSISCSFVWCGARTFSEYLSLLSTSCFGTFCSSAGVLQIDQSAPRFAKPLRVINSTNTSLHLEVFVSKVSTVRCISTPFLQQNISMDLLWSGVPVVPQWSKPTMQQNQALRSVLLPSDHGIAEISQLEANTIYRLFCFAEDLEIPANQMSLAEVIDSGIVYATDLNTDIGSCLLPNFVIALIISVLVGYIILV